MSHKGFIRRGVQRAELDEFLRKYLGKAGYGGAQLIRAPDGTRITVYATKPGMVIGRGGESIKELEKQLERILGVEGVKVAVAEIEVPELNPNVMANYIASALEKEVHFRRVGFWALNAIMSAGALGAEISIKGKLRTERATYEKYRAGYLLRAGDLAIKNLREATVHVQLKQGTFGIKVRILPPESKVFDKVSLKAEEAPKEAEEEAVSEE